MTHAPNIDLATPLFPLSIAAEFAWATGTAATATAWPTPCPASAAGRCAGPRGVFGKPMPLAVDVAAVDVLAPRRLPARPGQARVRIAGLLLDDACDDWRHRAD